MKLQVFIVFVLGIYLSITSFSDDAQEQRNDVVFSEMTIDSPPGDDGSWVELYNRSEKPVKLGGYTIVCNNKNVLTFPESQYLILNPKRLAIVRFDKNAKEITGDPVNSSEIITPPYSAIVKMDPKIAPKKNTYARHNNPYILQRSPGYCAIFKKGGINKENLIDYVFWGEGECVDSYKSVLNGEHSLWAKEKRFWNESGGIEIGLDPNPTEVSYSYAYMAIQRKLFSKDTELNDAWLDESLSDATPGEGNLWSPLSPIFTSSSHLYLGEKLKVDAFGYAYDRHLYEFLKANDSNGKEKIEIRLQIAKDPHFEEIIYNKLIPPEKEIDDYDFTLGTYYARVRIDMDKVCTDWSKALRFTYKEKETPEPE